MVHWVVSTWFVDLFCVVADGLLRYFVQLKCSGFLLVLGVFFSMFWVVSR